jgi:hypothetical protein
MKRRRKAAYTACRERRKQEDVDFLKFQLGHMKR